MRTWSQCAAAVAVLGLGLMAGGCGDGASSTGSGGVTGAEILRQPRQAVIEYGSEVLGPLEKALGSADRVTRSKAAVRLGVWAGRKGTAEQKAAVANALAGALDDPDADVRKNIVSALAEIGPAGLAGLGKALNDGDVPVRQQAALQAVAAAQGGSIPSPVDQDVLARMAEGIQRALEDPSPQVRAAAAEGLGSFGQRATADRFLPSDSKQTPRDPALRASVVRLLAGALEDDAPEVVREAAVSLWQLGPDNLAVLERAVEGPNAATRCGVLMAIAKLPVRADGAPQAGPIDLADPAEIAWAKDFVQQARRDGDLEVRLAAASAALALGLDPAWPDVLPDMGEALATGDPELRRRVLDGLAMDVLQDGTSEVKGEMARRLEAAIRSQDAAAADAVFTLLGNMGGEAIGAFESALQGDDPEYRRIAIERLGQMFAADRRGYAASLYRVGPEDEARAMAVIEKALQDPDRTVRLAAAQATMNLRSQPPPAGIVAVAEMILDPEAGLADHGPLLASIAAYVGRRGTDSQRAALRELLERVPDDPPPPIRAAAEGAAAAMRPRSPGP